jgi:hypothetical protein
MTRLALLLAAALVGSPAMAGTYAAKPAVAPNQGKIIAREVSWTCGPEACRVTTEESRPLVLCQGLAKRAGRLDSFVVDGRAFGPAELAKCNDASKDGAGILAKAN